MRLYTVSHVKGRKIVATTTETYISKSYLKTYMEAQNLPQWKTPIFNESSGQVVRILRPDEFKAVIRNMDAYDGAWNYFVSRNISTKTLVLWTQAKLYTGMRFSELIRLKNNPSYLEDDGNISLPYAPGEKEMRTQKSRTIYLSDVGRKAVRLFLDEAGDLPSGTKNNVMGSLSHLDDVLKAAAEKSGLPSRDFVKTRKRIEVNKDAYKKMEPIERRKVERRESRYIHTTGVCNRSMRASWESWLVAVFGSKPGMMERIFLSQGHKSMTALMHYLNVRFDADDILTMKKYVSGYMGIKIEDI